MSSDKPSDRLANPKRPALTIQEQYKMTIAVCNYKCVYISMCTYTKYVKFSKTNQKAKFKNHQEKTPIVKMENASVSYKRKRILDGWDCAKEACLSPRLCLQC